ncbi:PE domain-containing protein [Mycobacterium terramassiliense]|uniref:PE domain-containing protein n=1 Tax=Mycobacterium terramassiliense TaxID=1841859 RepID=UPI0009F9337E|nr:PE domain-containing protein [Mycobacterium terramassiliense]
MSFLIAAPEMVAAAATDLANIGKTIGSANGLAGAAAGLQRRPDRRPGGIIRPALGGRV